MPEGAGWLTWATADLAASTSTATITWWTSSTDTRVIMVSPWLELTPIMVSPWLELTPQQADVAITNLRYNDPQRHVEDEYEARPRYRYQEARRRAHETLLSLLTPEEQDRYERIGEIRVTGSAGGRYRILNGHSGNVINEHGQRYCAHPAMVSDGHHMPDADAMIAQMLMLITNEPEFLRVANAW